MAVADVVGRVAQLELRRLYVYIYQWFTRILQKVRQHAYVAAIDMFRRVGLVECEVGGKRVARRRGTEHRPHIQCFSSQRKVGSVADIIQRERDVLYFCAVGTHARGIRHQSEDILILVQETFDDRLVADTDRQLQYTLQCPQFMSVDIPINPRIGRLRLADTVLFFGSKGTRQITHCLAQEHIG